MGAVEELSGLTPSQWTPLLRKDLIAASLVLNLLMLVFPLVVLQVYDRIIPYQAYDTLFMLVMMVAITIVLDFILRTARSYIAGWAGANFEHKMGVGAVKRLLEADAADVAKSSAGQHLDRLAGVDQIRDFYSGQASLILIDLPFAVIFIGLMGYMAGWLALVPVVLIILYAWGSVNLGEQLRGALTKRSIIDRRRYSFLIENLRGIHTIKASGMESLIERRYEKLMQSSATVNMKVSFLSGLAGGLGMTFAQVTMAAVVGFGSFYVTSGKISVGGLAASTILAGRAVQPILRAMGVWAQMQGIRVAEDGLAELNQLTRRSIMDGVLVESINEIEVKDVALRFDGTTVFENISLNVKDNEIVAIKGDNGSGRTSLLRILAGLKDPDEGTVLCNGKPITRFHPECVHRNIAYLPQNAILFEGSVLDNITLFDDTIQIDEAISAASAMGLDNVLSKYSEGFDTQIGSTAQTQLPGGVAQSICIARAILRKPRFILFDEANSALDEVDDARLRQLLARLKGSVGIVLVSYRPSMLALADRCYELTPTGLQLCEVSAKNPESKSGPEGGSA